MSDSLLSPSSLLSLIYASIGSLRSAESSESGHSGTEPYTLRNPYDALATLVHACMLAVGFRLIGLEEDHKLETSIETQNVRPLPPGWNSSSSYSFRYAHHQSALEFCIKINRLGNKAVVLGIAIGDDKTTSFDIAVKDYFSESFFPYSPRETTDDQTSKHLRDAFISESRLRDLVSLVKINIIQKLIPGLSKPGYEEEQQEGARRTPSRSTARPPASSEYNEPPRLGPRHPTPYGPIPVPDARPIPIGGEHIPGFEDEYEILRPARGNRGFNEPERNPLSYGEEDLNPPGLGPNPLLRGPFFGEGGIPRPGFGGPPTGGMHPTADHPMFGGRGGVRGGLDPRIPPGARYDPLHPDEYDLDPTQGSIGPQFRPGGRGGGGAFGYGGGRRGPGGFGGGFGGFGAGDFI